MFPDAPLSLADPALRWRTVTVERGSTIRGFLCGKQRPVECHWFHEASRPCRLKLTAGKVPCYCQQEKHSLRTIAYVPIETREREQLVVIVPKSTALIVATFAQGAALEFSRAKRDKSPTRCRTILPEELGIQRHQVVSQEHGRDISRYLLHLWGDVVLQKHFEQKPDAAPPQPPVLIRKSREKKPPATDTSTGAAVVSRITSAIGLLPTDKV